MPLTYLPRRCASSRYLAVRGVNCHLSVWGDPTPGGPPPLLMMHGFMDVGASFQFVVDALPEDRQIIAPDWRGFGLTALPHSTDAYWFADYLGDLDALVDELSPDAPIDLLGHSMGGNVVMTYAGVRPERVRRLINLEGFGLPDLSADEAGPRMARWLDELKSAKRLRPYASLADVAARLRQNNPRLSADKAQFLAGHWSAQGDDGLWHLRADPAHKRINPVPYRAAEAVAIWRRISAPTLWVQGDKTATERWWRGRYSQAEFQQRLAVVPNVTQVLLSDAGHMLHHDQPQALANAIGAFLEA